jgi:Family of unknown function (DUF6519)
MKGDFSRLTFRLGRRFTSVRLQQGRVILDSDWNEQADIRDHLERVRLEDVLGSSAVPADGGFAVIPDRRDLSLSAGRIYVGGLVCELDDALPLVPVSAAGRTDLIYLDAWERHLTAVDDPDLLEVALGGADTTTRLQVTWKVGVVEDVGDVSVPEAASLLPSAPSGILCAAAPDGYRGSENQLYRVEIHDGGASESATFKWSRDNGSVVFAVQEFLSPTSVRVAVRAGNASELAVADSVEVSGDESELRGDAGTLARVTDVQGQGTIVALDQDVSRHAGESHPRIRRWDQRNAAVPVNTNWVELEAGIEVRFSDGTYRSGDYWTFPARPATASIEWPEDRTPDGIEHRLCPLALVSWDQAGRAEVRDCRRPFSPLTTMHAELARLRHEVDELRKSRRA